MGGLKYKALHASLPELMLPNNNNAVIVVFATLCFSPNSNAVIACNTTVACRLRRDWELFIKLAQFTHLGWVGGDYGTIHPLTHQASLPWHSPQMIMS